MCDRKKDKDKDGNIINSNKGFDDKCCIIKSIKYLNKNLLYYFICKY